MEKKLDLPLWLPVLPVRNTVLFPSTAVPLVVGRKKSVEAIKRAQENNGVLLIVAQKDGTATNPTPEDLYKVGCVCTVSKISGDEKSSYQLIATGLARFVIDEFKEADGYYSAKGEQQEDLISKDIGRIETLASQVKELGKTIINLSNVPGMNSILKLIEQVTDPSQIADLCCTFLSIPVHVKQELLETLDLEKRLTHLIEKMLKEKDKVELQNEIQNKMAERITKDQREHLLREQLRTIHEELGEEGNVVEEYRKKIGSIKLSSEAKKIAEEELSRLTSIPRTSPEYHVIRNYLDWLVGLPWGIFSSKKAQNIDLLKAKDVLDEEHFGIEKVKTRILQFLAVTKLKKDHKGPILCLMGPPGVGKTSIGKAIAKALNRKFIRISLGGVRDEAEIRGHRRTYVGALPGRLIQNLKRAGTQDPLIMLDEVDKIGVDFRGDPASALLEVLDPEQNHTFLDHYLDVPFDLSKVFFVTTANVLETIPPALKDRLEVIEMTSYSKSEKTEIARRHLLPNQIKAHGLDPDLIEFPNPILNFLIESYTREAGVRNLTREIAHLCRAIAEKWAKGEKEKVVVTQSWVEEVLGPKKFYTEEFNEGALPGVATGLAWTAVGGEILNIEARHMSGSGKLILTGHLGEVMKESAQIALSVLRSVWHQKFPNPIDKTDFHIHVPAGAIPKDGPSAGVAIYLALHSLIQNKAITEPIAFTGELTLRGSVLPVGGIKEKMLAAHRAGIKKVCLPKKNEGDLKEISEDVKRQLKFYFISDIHEAIPICGLSVPVMSASGTSTTYTSPTLHPA